MVNKIDGSIPEGYYDYAAERPVNAALQFVSRKIVQGVVSLTEGRLIIDTPPDSVMEVPKPVILTPTHRSNRDIPLSVTAAEKVGVHHIRPLGKKSLAKTGISGWFFHANGMIAVDRANPDIDGINRAFVHLLNNGENVMNYPEGERVREDIRRVGKLKGGAAWLSVLTGRPMLPLAFAGTAKEDEGRRPYGLGRPFVAVFGDPVSPPELPGHPSDREILRASRDARETLRDSLQICLDRAYEIRDEY